MNHTVFVNKSLVERSWDCPWRGQASKFLAPLTAAALQQFLAADGQGLGGEGAAIAKVCAHNAGHKTAEDGPGIDV